MTQIERRQDLILCAVKLHAAHLEEIAEQVRGNHQRQLRHAVQLLKEAIEYMGAVIEPPVADRLSLDELDTFLTDTQRLRALQL